MNGTEQGIQNEELAEEIDAINAIYDPSTVTITDTTATPNSNTNPAEPTSDSPITTTVILQIPNHPHISFLLGFDAEYPVTPPRIIGPASTQSRGEGKKWVGILSDSVEKVYISGSVCLYDMIEEAGERFDEVKATEPDQEPRSSGAAGQASHTSAHETSETTGDAEPPEKALLCSFELEHPPEWILSDPISEKRSVFVARVVRVQSKEQAEKYLDYLLATEKKVASATHNITAWRIRQKEQRKPDGTTVKVDTIVQDFDDDGETAAGGRLLHLMQLMDVWDVVVVVTRWYGGVKLGPDRFRIINAAARDALIKGGFSKQDSTEGQDKGKKKGKR